MVSSVLSLSTLRVIILLSRVEAVWPIYFRYLVIFDAVTVDAVNPLESLGFSRGNGEQMDSYFVFSVVPGSSDYHLPNHCMDFLFSATA